MPGRVFSAVFFLANLLFSPSAPSQTQSQTQPIGEASASPEITKIAVGFGPQGIAFTPGAIWVAYGNDTDSGVARIDAATNQVVARVPTGRWPVGAAAGEGAVWIANRDSDTVTRIDPESNRVVANINVGKKPVGVEVGEGSVWVTNMGGATVSIVDPKTNGVTATIHVGTQPSGISISNGAVWVVDAGGPLSHSGSLVRIDPRANAVTMKIKVPWSNFVLVQGDDVWVATLQGPVLRINGKSGKRAAWIPVGGAAGGLAFSQGILWVADNSFAKLAKIDVQTTTVVGRVVVGKNPMILGRGVDSDGAIWVSNVDDGTVMKVKP